MRRLDFADDTGSTIPLILGFFLIGLLVVAGSVTASDAFTKQRDLQSICDGAAIATANSLDLAAARGSLSELHALPLGGLQDAAEAYLQRDSGRDGATVVVVDVSTDGVVTLSCRRRTRLAFAGLFGFGAGIDQSTSSSARSPLG
jgi:Flp pilus assembly protein TadG